jgi:glutathione peroxidase
MSSLADFTVTTIEGQAQPMADYLGRVLLVVNVASRCGFTSQYAGLQQLQDTLGDKGLTVLGFPCNQFGGQEPGDEASIQSFCQTSYGVNFPMFSKIEVNGAGADPLFVWLKSSKPGLLGTEAIKWNFTKFLIDRQGNVVKRYGPNDAPKSIRADIEALL